MRQSLGSKKIVRKFFGSVFMQGYAQTEVPLQITILRREDHDPARPELLASCGVDCHRELTRQL